MPSKNSQNEPTCRFSLRLPLVLEYISTASILGRMFCESLGLNKGTPELGSSVELATSEACTNAVKHAGDGDLDAVFTVTYEIFPDKLVISVEDPNAGFDAAEIPDPDLEQHQEGGYGLFIIKSCMDVVTHSRSGKKNLLTMTMHLQSGESE